MISSTSSPDRTPRPELITSTGQAAPHPAAPRADKIATLSAEFLRSELQRQPEIRPEVVERARGLAADPNYPSPEILRHVANQLLAAPDLTEQGS